MMCLIAEFPRRVVILLRGDQIVQRLWIIELGQETTELGPKPIGRSALLRKLTKCLRLALDAAADLRPQAVGYHSTADVVLGPNWQD